MAAARPEYLENKISISITTKFYKIDIVILRYWCDNTKVIFVNEEKVSTRPDNIDIGQFFKYPSKKLSLKVLFPHD